jgi:hypothetical protein
MVNSIVAPAWIIPIEALKSMTLRILAVLSLDLMFGSELNVAAFAQPTFNRQSLEVHVLMLSSFAALFGE